MDFGKLAFKRVEELESVMRNSSRGRISSNSFSVRPNFNLNAKNQYIITSATGRGKLSLFVKINVNVIASGRVAILVNNNKLGFTDFKNVGNDEQVMLLSCRLEGQSNILSLQAQNGLQVNIVSLQLILIGESASFSRRAGSFVVDESRDVLGVLYSSDGVIQLNCYRFIALDTPITHIVGRGNIADMVGDTLGGFYVCYVDSSQNFWVVHVNHVGVIRRLKINESNIASAAIALDKRVGEIVIAFVVEGRVFNLTASIDLVYSTASIVLESERAEAVSFVKGSLVPILLSTRGGRIFIRKPQLELVKSKSICLDADVSISVTFNVI